MYMEVFGFGDRNEGGLSFLDFAKAFDLEIANSSFQKKEDHLVNFRSTVAKTQIDYSDRSLCKDCKGVRSEYVTDST